MTVLNSLAASLAFLGRHGTRAVAASIFVGLLLAPLATTFKPYLGEAIFVLLVAAFMRVDLSDMRMLLRSPGLVLAAVLWVMIVVPVLLGTLVLALGIDDVSPGLYFILILQVCAPALMSSPALARMIGLDVPLTLASMLLCTALAPLTASFFTYLFLGAALIDPLNFGFTLFLLIGGSAAVAGLIRLFAGHSFVETHSERIDGLSVLAMCVFAVAAMEGITGHAIASPITVIGLTILAFAIALGLIAATTLIFIKAGRERAFAIGVLAGNRNIGVLLAAAGFAAPDLAWLYFGLAQFPIYLLPALLKLVAERYVASR